MEYLCIGGPLDKNKIDKHVALKEGYVLYDIHTSAMEWQNGRVIRTYPDYLMIHSSLLYSEEIVPLVKCL
jgi:hypothetical protein